MRAVQPPQGRPAAAPGQHAPAVKPAPRARTSSSSWLADDPGDLAPIPPRGCLSLALRARSGELCRGQNSRPGDVSRAQTRWPRQRAPVDAGAPLTTMLDLSRASKKSGARGLTPASVAAVHRCGFRYRRGPAPAGLAAGHLQCPTRTVTQLRTTPFLW
jgi:hypothetical protein